MVNLKTAAETAGAISNGVKNTPIRQGVFAQGLDKLMGGVNSGFEKILGNGRAKDILNEGKEMKKTANRLDETVALREKHMAERGVKFDDLSEKEKAIHINLQNKRDSLKIDSAMSNVKAAGTWMLGEGSIPSAAFRIGGTLGALDVGSRVLGPGTLTKDAQGNQDIAGIPFI